MNKRALKVFTVLSAHKLTPNMIRVTLTGSEIGDMEPDCHGANCKLFLPEVGQSRDDFKRQMEEGPRPVVRTYTVRQIRKDLNEMDIDFVYHGDGGPASAWAGRAQPGDFCGFGGPGLAKMKSFYADSYLVVADMSAIPVTAAALEAMPEDAKGTAIFEILAEEDRQNFRIPKGIKCHWIVNPNPHIASDVIPKMISTFDWPSGVIQTCIAGESGMIKALRQELLVARGMPKDDCYISGYWKIGLIEDEHQKMKREEAATS